jgi:hypothetical protein
VAGNQLLLWRAKPAAILARIDKDEDHVTQVIRIIPQRREVVLITGSIRVTPQEPEVLYRHRPIGQKLVQRGLTFRNPTQDFSVCLRADIAVSEAEVRQFRCALQKWRAANS